MTTHTTLLNLAKSEASDLYQTTRTDNNGNADILEAQVKKCYVGTLAPTSGDDSGDGYSIGSHWVQTVGPVVYVCTDASVGAAYWRQVWPIPSAYVTNDMLAGSISDANLAVSYIKADGSRGLSAAWTIAYQIISTLAIGTSPFSVVSTTKVANLNSDLLDDLEATAFVKKTDFTGKGAIQVASGANTPANFAAGTDGQVPVAHAAETQGIVWLNRTPGLYYNAVINPQFQVNQRAIASYTSSTNPANNDDTYLIDQVNLLSDGNNIVSVAPEASVVPISAPSAMKFTQVTINKKSGYIKFLENTDALKFAGKSVSFQIKAATSAGHVINNIRVAILTRTGTADTLTSDPVSAWGAQGVTPTWIAEWTCQNTPANLALTTSYQIFKIENISIPAGITNLAYMVWIDDTDAAVGDIVYFGDEQLNEGPICLPFMPSPYSETLTKCRRFLRCWGGAAAYERIGNGACHTTIAAFVYLPFDVPMRIAPIIESTSAANTFAIYPVGVALSAAPLIDPAGSTTQGVNFALSAAGGLTVGQVATFCGNNSTSMYLRITAVL